MASISACASPCRRSPAASASSSSRRAAGVSPAARCRRASASAVASTSAMLGGVLQTYDPRNADIRYWVNGMLRHRDEPGLSPFDSVVQGGDAVWEGLRLYDGKIYGLSEHLARLRRSAAALGFTGVPDES